MALAASLGVPAAAIAGASPAPDLTGTHWTLPARVKVKRKQRSEEGAPSGAETFDSVAALRLLGDGRFLLEGDGGDLFVDGDWAQVKSKLLLEPEFFGAQAAGGPPRVAGVPVAAPGTVDILSAKFSAKAATDRAGQARLAVAYKLKFRVSGEGGVHDYTASVKGIAVPAEAPPPGPANQPPVARAMTRPAGGLAILRGGRGRIALDATASDDGDDGSQGLLYLWSKVSGPPGDAILHPGDVVTEVEVRRAGTYIYELAVSDGQRQNAVDTDQVAVEARYADGEAVLTWDPPLENADGTPLDDLDGFFVYYGECLPGEAECPDDPSRAPAMRIDVQKATTFRVQSLVPGVTYYFFVTAYDRVDNESAPSLSGYKTIP